MNIIEEERSVSFSDDIDVIGSPASAPPSFCDDGYDGEPPATVGFTAVTNSSPASRWGNDEGEDTTGQIPIQKVHSRRYNKGAFSLPFHHCTLDKLPYDRQGLLQPNVMECNGDAQQQAACRTPGSASFDHILDKASTYVSGTSCGEQQDFLQAAPKPDLDAILERLDMVTTASGRQSAVNAAIMPPAFPASSSSGLRGVRRGSSWPPSTPMKGRRASRRRYPHTRVDPVSVPCFLPSPHLATRSIASTNPNLRHNQRAGRRRIQTKSISPKILQLGKDVDM